MKVLLTVTAVIEGLTGLALLIAPSILTPLLLGATLDGDGAFIIARLAGTALFSLAIVCMFSRKNDSASVVVKAMMFYNVIATSLLLYGAIGYKFQSVGLVAAVLVHSGLTVWCFIALGQDKKHL